MNIYKISMSCDIGEESYLDIDTYLTHENAFSEKEFDVMCREALDEIRKGAVKEKNVASVTKVSDVYLENYLIEKFGFKKIKPQSEFEYDQWV